METPATEENPEAIAPQQVAGVTLPTEDDLEARFKQLEQEKDNYKEAYLKLQRKSKGVVAPEDDDEDPDERMRRIAAETLADSKLVEITREQQDIISKALKENTELKLALKNKPDIPASQGASTEGPEVRDTLVTPEQLAAFKAKGWSDQDIARYKENLRKNGR